MYFLNLSLLQFLAVFGSISAVSVALYLLDRSRRRLVVSTLRFWVAAEQPAVAARRRRISSPGRCILQLVSMALLLLAIGAAALRLAGAGGARSRHRSRHFGLDGRALRQPHPDGPGPRTRPPVPARPARARPRHAGARRRPGHSGHRLRTGPREDRGRHRRLRGRAPPRSTSIRRWPSRATFRHRKATGGRRNRLRRRGPHRRARSRRPRRCRAICACCWCRTPSRMPGSARSACGAPRHPPTLWEIYVSVHNYGSAARAPLR